MVDACPRCEAALPLVEGEAPPFCWNCGLPQLRVSESVLEAAAAREAAPAEGQARTPVPVRPGALDWPLLLLILLGATVVGLLPCVLLRDVLFSGAAAMPVLFLLPVLCLASGFVYLRRRPARRMTAGGGARMGLALGTMLAFAVTTVTGISAFALRYGKHNRSLQQNFDAVMLQAEAQVRASQPNAPEHLLQAMRSPEWHAGWFLIMQGALMLLLMGSGVIAGMVAGVLLRSRVPVERMEE